MSAGARREVGDVAVAQGCGDAVRDVPQEGREHRSVSGDAMTIVKEVPTEFFEGEWHFSKPDGPEPWAVVTYAENPSPETGHVGWCWWAMGSMGEAPTYEAARDAAMVALKRRVDIG
jgi:hypothetical protein